MKNTLKLLALAALIASAGLAQAATATGNVPVTATVTANCTISTTAVAFGAYDPVAGGNIAQAGNVVVACTKGATGLWVGLGGGANAVGAQRNMVGGTSTDKLAYNLMQPTAATPGAACPAYGAGSAWTNTVGATSLALSASTSKTGRTYNVCGQLASGQDVSVDSYTDSVVATINF
jgi:spore coat protein U-like protein